MFLLVEGASVYKICGVQDQRQEADDLFLGQARPLVIEGIFFQALFHQLYAWFDWYAGKQSCYII